MTLGAEGNGPESNARHQAVFGKLNHAEWLGILVKSLRESVIDGVPMPTSPAPAIQAATHGTSGPQALLEAGRFVALVDQYTSRESMPIIDSTRVLDLGCGWGRMLRMFLNRVDARDLLTDA